MAPPLPLILDPYLLSALPALIASSTAPSAPPLERPSHHAYLLMSLLCHPEMREGRGCLRRAELQASPRSITSSPLTFLKHDQIPWKQVTKPNDSGFPRTECSFTLSIVPGDGFHEAAWALCPLSWKERVE